MNNNKKRGVRRGLWGHSFKSSYSLELNLYFLETSFRGEFPRVFWFSLWWPKTLILVKTHSPSTRDIPGRALFFAEKHVPENLETIVCDFQEFGKCKRRGKSPEPGYTKYEPVMFDMDPFGGKKLPCTKYRESDGTGETKLNNNCLDELHLFQMCQALVVSVSPQTQPACMGYIHFSYFAWVG